MAQSSQTYLPAINMIFYVSISICEILLRKETHRGTVLLCQSVRQDVVPPPPDLPLPLLAAISRGDTRGRFSCVNRSRLDTSLPFVSTRTS